MDLASISGSAPPGSPGVEKAAWSLADELRGAPPDQLAELPRGHGGRKEETLDLGAAERAQDLELLGGLDALGDHALAEGMRHRDDRRHDRLRIGPLPEALDEHAVDLDRAHRIALE